MSIQRFENGPRFCRVLAHQGTVYVAGIVAGLLARAGSNKSKLLTAQIWLRDIADFERMNTAWDAWIDRSAMPVRATVEARLAGDGYRVEIMVTAAV